MGNTVKEDPLRDRAIFVSFCVEQYAHLKAMQACEVCDLFYKHGVLEYLDKYYDELHRYGHLWLLDEIDEFLEARVQEGKG